MCRLNCCWPSRAQSFSGPSPTGLITTFYCLRFPQPGVPSPHICILQEQGAPVIPPGTGFPFRCLLRLAGLRWGYSTLPPHRLQVTHCSVLVIISRRGPHRKHHSSIVACISVAPGACVPSSSLETVAVCSPYLAERLYTLQYKFL